MTPLRIFVSSVQKEFAAERAALRDYLRNDALMRRFFEVFLFEDTPAADQRADALYLDEAARCDLYIGLFGHEYGYEGEQGVSPTEHEFEAAGTAGKVRLIFVKGADDGARHPKMRSLVSRVGSELIRRRFSTTPELIAAVYASLVRVLEEREFIRFTPFDATFCRDATFADLDEERISRFLVLARRGRSFPLQEATPPNEVLEHLNLLDRGRPTHAAVLLFGRQPQRHLPMSEVRCAHFHGTDVAKPIPSLQVYKGTVFELVDQAKDFVLSKIALWVGTRAEGSQVPTAYEIPQEVVVEAIVNAVCHRDYTSSASVQVMLFSDRLEVWNPGALPPTLTMERLKYAHPSVPANPLLAEPMYLARYIERMGTGIRDMIDRCREAGLREPEFRVDAGTWVTTLRRKATGEVTGEVAGDVTAEVARLLVALHGEMTRVELQKALGLKHDEHFRLAYLQPAMTAGLVEMTVPDKPRSRSQKYRLTATGKAAVRVLNERKDR